MPVPTKARFLAFAPIVFVLLWSTGFLGTKGATLNADPFAYLALRFSLAAVLMTLLTVLFRAPWPKGKQGHHAIVTGLLLHAGYLGGVTYAISLHLPAGVTAVLVGLQPLLTGLLSWPLLGERVGKMQWLGLVLGFVGVLFVVLGKSNSAFVYNPPALVAAAFALVFTTAGTLYQRKFGAQMPLLGGTTYQYAASALAIGAIVMIKGGGAIHWNTEFIVSLVWLVLVLSLGAILLLMYLIKAMPAASVSSLFYLVPPLTVLESYLLFSERLTPFALVGLGFCVLGVALSSVSRAK